MTPDQILKRFGKRLQNERVSRGLSLRDLADRADTSHQNVAAFEAGTGNHLRNLMKIAEKLDFELKLGRPEGFLSSVYSTGTGENEPGAG
jgi:transcriptional regulator with XRE-family HTH domain